MAEKITEKNTKKMSFELRLERLHEIVTTLEQGEVSLADSVVLYKEGLSHTKLCKQELEKAHHEIQILTQNEDGEYSWDDFNIHQESIKNSTHD